MLTKINSPDTRPGANVEHSIQSLVLRNWASEQFSAEG